MASVKSSSTIAYHQFLMDEASIEDEQQRVIASPWNWSSPRNDTFEEQEPYEGPEWILVPIVFGLIFVVGVVGNGTLIFTVLVNKNMRTTPNVLLVSLAVGDLMLILFTIPLMSTVYTFHSWQFGEVACKLGEFTISLSLGVSVFTLTALSAERYIVIVHPMSSVSRSAVGVATSSLLRTVLVAVGIWVLATALASIELVAARVTPGPVGFCVAYPVEWSDTYISFHVIFRFIIYFALPITTIAFFYALMAHMLIVSTKQMPGEGGNGYAAKQVTAATANFLNIRVSNYYSHLYRSTLQIGLRFVAGLHIRVGHGLDMSIDWIGAMSSWIRLNWVTKNRPMSNSAIHCLIQLSPHFLQW